MVLDRQRPPAIVATQDRESRRASCACEAAVQSGEHIVWDYYLHQYERVHNWIMGTSQWEDLDGKIWVPGEGGEDDDNQVDGVERFFDYLSYQF